ncbi:hypothetical protein Pmani_025810 [Petrolisthes manimaculis]|uniref:Uncharacterized protein n=1 Tax=Petrolisthes manimaculis TaxID=1843537 RepID=A0AAE1P777_9EUCA|nr:hypothetical protein Pmani_025810 [Petrolisthes manimaculis]
MEVIRTIVGEIEVLKDIIHGRSEIAGPAASVDKAKLIASQVTQIKKKIKTLKLEGRIVYNDLEREESILQREIQELRQLVSEEESTRVKFQRGQHQPSRRTKGKHCQCEGSSCECGGTENVQCPIFHSGALCNENKLLIVESNCVPELKKKLYGKEALAENTGTEKESQMQVVLNINMIDDLNDEQNKNTEIEKTEGVECTVVMPKFKHSWETKDHSQFLKIHRKYRLPHRRLQEWQTLLTYKSVEEIEHHAAKYEAYLREKHVVKGQLIQWRSEKEQRKMEQLDKAMQDKVAVEENLKGERQAKEKNLRREREKRYQKLALWKESMQSEVRKVTKVPADVQTKTAGSRSCDIQPRHRIMAFTDEERKVMESQLQDYHERKVRQRELELKRKQEEEDYRKQLQSNNHNRRRNFRERDEEYQKFRREERAREERQREEQARRLEKIKISVKVEAERDPGRVTRPTMSRLAYTHTPSPLPNTVLTVHVDDIPHLATPAWRQDFL